MSVRKSIFAILGICVIAGGAVFVVQRFQSARLDEATPEEVHGVSSSTSYDTGNQSATDSARGSDSTESPREESTVPAPVLGTAGHPAKGTARVIVSNGKQFLRYENFKTINGPDIFVYLSKDLEAKKFIDLGPVRATEGNVNYEIPENVNPKEYPYALVWCKAFGVLFNSAKVQ